jgi:hypothetical protein
MVLIQDASFEKPKMKGWKKKFVQLDFSVSIKELDDLSCSLKKQSKGSKLITKNTKWLCVAFLEKCQCPQCKDAWTAFEKKQVSLLKRKNSSS